MALVHKIHTQDAIVYLWKIQETLEDLLIGIKLKQQSIQRVENMKSITHQKGFIAIRQLLKIAGYCDDDLWYDQNGRPNLKDGKFISISHSFEFASIIVGNSNVGIDIEQKREKIIKIAPKFCNQLELDSVSKSKDQIDLYSEIWCVKESMYKMCQSRSLSFREHMSVNLQGQSRVFRDGFERLFTYHVLNLENFMLAYAFEKS
ncbi:4'-phosphopantetheinyl transferase family protein [Myroides sp. LJL119]